MKIRSQKKGVKETTYDLIIYEGKKKSLTDFCNMRICPDKLII